jgi:hypothetical protein
VVLDSHSIGQRLDATLEWTASRPRAMFLARVLVRVILGAMLVWVAYLGWSFVTLPNVGPAAGGADHATLMEAARRWLAGGPFYLPNEVAGPYQLGIHDVLYPPPMIPFFALFPLLPPILWWIVPIATTAAVVVYWRPALVGWIGILACLAIPATWEVLAYGNPAMWIAALAALGTVLGWPAVLVVLKPSLAPFMLLGVRRRSWWLVAALLALVSVAFLPLWSQYIGVVLNARGPRAGILYSLNDFPLMLIPVLAWATRRRRTRPGAEVGTD